VAEEGGCVVTDAYGHSLEETLLLDTSENNMQSFIAAANSDLHRQILERVEEGFRRMKKGKIE